MLCSYRLLQVHSVHQFGAWLCEGQDQFWLPSQEMSEKFRRDHRSGDSAVVYLWFDDEQQPIASMKLGDFVKSDTSQLRIGQAVDLLLFDESELGYSAIVDQRYAGIIYHSEVFQRLSYGQQLKGYIGKVRPDGKLDLLLQPPGVRGATDLGELILQRLRESGGFLPLSDRTEPEAIYSLFGVSKKKFKIALGGLYRRQLVQLETTGIRLV